MGQQVRRGRVACFFVKGEFGQNLRCQTGCQLDNRIRVDERFERAGLKCPVERLQGVCVMGDMMYFLQVAYNSVQQ